MIPYRVKQIVDQVAQAHEVNPQDILGRNTTSVVEAARMECYRAALRQQKLNGQFPTKSEVALWFGRSRAAITRATKENGKQPLDANACS
jgi:hypothetical protein